MGDGVYFVEQIVAKISRYLQLVLHVYQHLVECSFFRTLFWDPDERNAHLGALRDEVLIISHSLKKNFNHLVKSDIDIRDAIRIPSFSVENCDI